MKKRKLASVQYVHDITPIDGADKIECVHVLGWQCVSSKDQFHVGDKCVYIEVDAFLPICDDFEFMRNGFYVNSDVLGEGFRVKTIKMRGQISQGLVMPLSILPKGEYHIGDNVADVLGIKKWEIEEKVTSSGTAIADFPDFVSKTDELRVQSFPDLIYEFKSVPEYYISTKMDGTSVTMYWKDGKFGVCGRNYEYADDDKCSMWKYAHKYNIPEKIKDEKMNVAIQGEFCGVGIQSNRLRLVTPEWYVFTIVNLDTKERFTLKELLDFCDKYGLKHVPIEEVGNDFKYESVDELIERAKGKYFSGHNKEGIVIRPTVPVYSKIIDGPLSMKVINNEYLLKD